MSQTENETGVADRPLLYTLEDRPPLGRGLISALAHLLAIVASIIAAPLLIANALQLPPADVFYVVNASLVVSGIATFIQVYRFGWVGSGLLAVQGTSFTFIGPMAFAASYLALGDDHETLMGILLGTAAVGAAFTAVLSFFLTHLQRVITPAVTGTTIFLLGLTLVATAYSNLQLTVTQAEAAGRHVGWVWAQAAVVIAAIAWLATRANPWVRLASICVGLLVGFVFAALTGWVESPEMPATALFVLEPGRYELGFDAVVLLLFLPIFLVSVTESIGDITATSMLSKQPIQGPQYLKRLRGGILADGLNTILAAACGSFPNTTFSQNNAVIQITGVASRFVGLLLAALLVLLGVVPWVSTWFVMLPGGVLNGATGFLFALIAFAGWRIIRLQAGAQGLRVLLTASAIALLLTQLPTALGLVGVSLPRYAEILLAFPVATGAVAAMLIDSGLRLARPGEVIT